jgi:hypothetical protein
MSFTYTEYTTETVKETAFRTLDKKYLPEEVVLQDELNTALANKQDKITGAVSTILDVNVEPNKIIVSDDVGKLLASGTSLEDISIAHSALAPGSITWNRDLENRTIVYSGELDGM